jgi:very-short-patch-repair endonuclease
MPTFAEYLEKWLQLGTVQGLTNPLVKMPVKRFRLLLNSELRSISEGGALIIGTQSDPIARNLLKNYQSRIRERGERCAFICYGVVEMVVAGGSDNKQRKQLFPVLLKRASLQATGDKVKVAVSDDEAWQPNPVLMAHLKSIGIPPVPISVAGDPSRTTDWIKVQLGNRASKVSDESYVGLFSSQQMVVQSRLTEPSLRKALAKNPVIQAKVSGSKIVPPDLGEITDDGLEDLGLALPCDDSQLRVVQLSNLGQSLQVEGPPGTGKSQTIGNIISNALFHGRNVLLVCDKKAAIDQVAERLSQAGLKPALLNLHDEDLDKREFLKQATERFPASSNSRVYPFSQLKEVRKTLNERVRFSRGIAHPSLQVTKREALAGLIQLKKELGNVPVVPVTNWQSLSKERLAKLIACISEWPDLSQVLMDNQNTWNLVKVEEFEDNPNIKREIEDAIGSIHSCLESLETAKELASTVGIDLPLGSDAEASNMLALVSTVLKKPSCHNHLVGNIKFTLSELAYLKLQWERRQQIFGTRHPVELLEPDTFEMQKANLAVAERVAKELLNNEGVGTWDDLARRALHHADRKAEIGAAEKSYQRLCDRLGLVHVPSLAIRRAQIQRVLALADLGVNIPRNWWKTDLSPVHAVAEWKAFLSECARHVTASLLPIHFVALEQVSATHWKHVEAMAENGFNFVSYCVSYIDDRRCKYALRLIFPKIPSRGYKHWQEATLHAVAAFRTVRSLRTAAEAHVGLKQLTSAYLAAAHDGDELLERYLKKVEVRSLEETAAAVEQNRKKPDFFILSCVQWETFWESPDQVLVAAAKAFLAELDMLALPDRLQTDDLEEAARFHSEAHEKILAFLSEEERKPGDRTNSVIASFSARRDFADCQKNLAPLEAYLELHGAASASASPNWPWLEQVIGWRDQFERMCGRQKLDIDSALWATLQAHLTNHEAALMDAYGELDRFFDFSWTDLPSYVSLTAKTSEVVDELPRFHLWLEKRRWNGKISAYPEIKAIWEKTLNGAVPPDHGERLFCFNLLRLCDPVAKPHGSELKQALREFVEQDENLASWVVDHLKKRLKDSMTRASEEFAQSESELRRLTGLQRIRGTVRELVNAHMDYLVAAKPCWLMSPTSLANIVDSRIFDQMGVPFDLVVFDEASQVRVLDGLLSMSFGKQVIIVGDKNQLPPTDFFSGFASPDSDSEDVGTSESLLEEFGGVFEADKSQVMLMSHYRSETPDLISFSNKWFYANKLEIYPPSHVSGTGRRLHYVADAIYSETGNRDNAAEAKEVAKLIELHVHENPDKSLGVVTMNLSQLELIDELILSTPETVRHFCADESKFFLRNLESVQGDEMDRIILSLTYGKNDKGVFNAAILGPLIKSGGERRLNVAITRSRSGLIVVTSLKVADLDASNAQSRGFNCLRDFLGDLEFADRARTFGISNQRFERTKDGVSNLAHCESPFEEQVVEFLENEGYEIECQYGAGKFRLDIVVKERGKNLLAIECDGAAYHSSLVARTRDRARQRILEKLGWKIHRVWSTNWWHFEQQEKEAIIAAIGSARPEAMR